VYFGLQEEGGEISNEWVSRDDVLPRVSLEESEMMVVFGEKEREREEDGEEQWAWRILEHRFVDHFEIN
jgi:hypothetical protein